MYLSAISSIRSLRERANARASRSASAPVVASSRWHASSGNFASTGTRRSPSLRTASTRSPERNTCCIWYWEAGRSRRSSPPSQTSPIVPRSFGTWSSCCTSVTAVPIVSRRFVASPSAPSRSCTSRSTRVWSALPRSTSSTSSTTRTTIAIATAADTLRPPGHGAGNLLLVGADPLTVSRRARLDECGAGVLEEAVGCERRRVQVGDGLVARPDPQGRQPGGPGARRFERLRQPSGHLHRACGGGRGGKHRELAPAEAADRVRRAAARLEDLSGVRDGYGWRRQRRGMAVLRLELDGERDARNRGVTAERIRDDLAGA